MAWKRHSDDDRLPFLREIEAKLSGGLDIIISAQGCGFGMDLNTWVFSA